MPSYESQGPIIFARFYCLVSWVSHKIGRSLDLRSASLNNAAAYNWKCSKNSKSPEAGLANAPEMYAQRCMRNGACAGDLVT